MDYEVGEVDGIVAVLGEAVRVTIVAGVDGDVFVCAVGHGIVECSEIGGRGGKGSRDMVESAYERLLGSKKSP